MVALILGGVGAVLLAIGVWGTFLRPDELEGARDAARDIVTPTADRSSVDAQPTAARPVSDPQSSRATQMPSAVPTSEPTPTPSAQLTVLDLVVCDTTIDCGIDPAQTIWLEVTACLRTKTEDIGRLLSLAITDRDTPPIALTDSTVVARSAPVQGSGEFRCYPVRAVNAPLSGRVYWLWVLAEGGVVGPRLVMLAR